MVQLGDEALNKFTSKNDIPTGTPVGMIVASVTIFTFTLVVYLGINFGYKEYLNSAIADSDKKISALSSQINDAAIGDFLVFYSQMANLQNILANHSGVSGAMAFLEKNTIKDVYYTSIDLNTKTQTAVLTGYARSYDALVQQLSVFENLPDVEKVKASNPSFGDNKVNFSLTLKLNKNLFLFK